MLQPADCSFPPPNKEGLTVDHMMELMDWLNGIHQHVKLANNRMKEHCEHLASTASYQEA